MDEEISIHIPNTPLQLPVLSATNAVREAELLLSRAQIETAGLDARVLLQHVLGVSREWLLGHESLELTLTQKAAYQAIIEKRCRRQPVAQLTGKREFYGREFKVTQDTLDPRADSEALVEAVLEWVAGHGSWVMGKNSNLMTHDSQPITILDMGTGTGCLLLTLLKECDNAKGVGVDKSEQALKVARENAENLGVAARAEFVDSHWGDKVKGTFDIIISNPPYIPTLDIAGLAPEVSQFEPKLALDGGEDGLDCYRALMPQVSNFLAPGGLAAFEIGMGQEEEVEKIVASYELRVTGIKCDLGGIPRCILIAHHSSPVTRNM